MPPIAILGINEDAALTPEAAAILARATLVAGGVRHLALAAPLITGTSLPWPSPMDQALPEILAHDGRVAILASGDPLWFGVATMLLRHLPIEQLNIIPAPSSFQLAAARLGWPLQDTICLSCCGRPVAAIIPHLQPETRLLILSAGSQTPAEIQALLTARGLSHTITILENLTGPKERIHKPSPLERGLGVGQPSALNLVALEIHGPTPNALALTPGRADPLFETDGQITKSEIRAMTLAALAPRRGELLWDVGAGSGAIGIEWMLAHPANRAIGLEPRPDRAARARRNAENLGVPALQIIEASAPDAFATLPQPQAIFLGGGAHRDGVIDAAWAALPEGGRLVANAVALQTEATLIAAQARIGGTLTRIAIERLDQVGTMAAYRPAMTITQWLAPK
jgi:precorrin-6Y C5,15-methyltransferase (decarboxylating)